MVDDISTERHETVYACCVEPYPDVTFTIHMRRGSLFYVVNLIAPCFLIFVISFLGFFLPVESGDKVNLEITILLALVVFLLMVGETMPPIPDVIPILGLFDRITFLFFLNFNFDTLLCLSVFCMFCVIAIFCCIDWRIKPVRFTMCISVKVLF